MVPAIVVMTAHSQQGTIGLVTLHIKRDKPSRRVGAYTASRSVSLNGQDPQRRLELTDEGPMNALNEPDGRLTQAYPPG